MGVKIRHFDGNISEEEKYRKMLWISLFINIILIVMVIFLVVIRVG